MAAFEETTWNTEMATSSYVASHRLSFICFLACAGFLNHVRNQCRKYKHVAWQEVNTPED